MTADSEVGTSLTQASFTSTSTFTLAPQVKRALEKLARTHIWDSGTSQHTFTLEENFISLRPYSGNGILGIGGKSTQPKATGTYKVHALVNGEHSFALLKDALWNPEAAST